jgi:F0F1-type ATP synthase membrane subunit c/vacuolar-type H+-ATPase subunit K
MTSFESQPPQKTNGLAVAGFVTGLACCSPVGIVLSAIALSQISADPSQKGKGLAQAGLIIGIISFVISLIFFSVGAFDSLDY